MPGSVGSVLAVRSFENSVYGTMRLPPYLYGYGTIPYQGLLDHLDMTGL